MPYTNSSNTCPLCGGTSPARVVTASSWSIQACGTCSNAWTLPPPDAIDYEAKDFHQETNAIEAATQPEGIATLPREWQASIRQQVALLSRYVPKGGRVLEVGCGSGILLGQLRDDGFDVVGLEPSRSACDRARKTGLRVYEGYFPDAALTAAEPPFDAVAMTHVLEHIREPIDTLREVAGAAPGGVLMLVQTHWRGLVPRRSGKRWYAWVPDEHFWHFTPAGLRHICEPLGFEPIETEFSSLVHSRRSERMLAWCANLKPAWHDQFHQLLRLPEHLSAPGIALKP